MVKINDPVLAEAGIQLANEKQLPVATLADQLVLTLEGETFRRRLLMVSDTAVPTGTSGANFLATYRTPLGSAIRWFAGSVDNANQNIVCEVRAEYDSSKGVRTVAYSRRRILTNTQANIIGAAGSGFAAAEDFVADSVWTPPGGLLILDIRPNAGNFDVNAITWAILGWTEAIPRTGTDADVLQPFKAIVAP